MLQLFAAFLLLIKRFESKLTDIGACDEARCVEVDANEFALKKAQKYCKNDNGARNSAKNLRNVRSCHS